MKEHLQDKDTDTNIISSLTNNILQDRTTSNRSRGINYIQDIISEPDSPDPLDLF